MEEARAMAAKQRVQQIEELVSENGNLKEEVRVLNERLRAQADEMGQVRREMSLVESSLFRANSEVRIGSYGMWKAHDMTSGPPQSFLRACTCESTYRLGTVRGE